MIRPPPTGISLSSHDISLHLHHLDVYHGLLKQGFKKTEIHRYLREQRQVDVNEKENLELEVSCNAYHDVEPARAHDRASDRKDEQEIRVSPSTRRTIKSCPTETNASVTAVVGLHSGWTQPEPSTPQGLARSSSPALPESRTHSASEDHAQLLIPKQKQRTLGGTSAHHHHIPRQSSLLRFSSNMSPSEQDSKRSFPSVPFSLRSQVKYRPRAATYSYDQLEAETDDSTSMSIITCFEQLALDESLVPATMFTMHESKLRGDAEIFQPHTSPSQVHEAIETSNEHDLPGTFLEGLLLKPLAAQTSRILPRLQPQRPKTPANPVEMVASSPPLIDGRHDTEHNVSSHDSPDLPAMPSAPISAARVSRTRHDPDKGRFRYLDGQSFTTYDDSLPADIQPQTPAELSRQPVIDEFNAVYTAPPGGLRSRLSLTTPGLEIGNQGNQESPTNRAISMRRRRNREFARSARVEGLRVSRLRERFQSERANNGQRTNRWEGDEQFNLWRDDLDADRVGEENFEDVETSNELASIGVRVVSGNRRANGV